MKRILKTRTFNCWLRKTLLSNTALLKAIAEMERGLVDADLGGNVYKKRVALPGRGKSGSTRTLIATIREDRWIFMYGFEKNEIFLTYSSDELQLAIAKGEFFKVHHDEA